MAINHRWACVLLLTSVSAFAAPKWEMIPAESSLTFTGTMNDAPTSGSFKSFDGQIEFDKDKLDHNHVHIKVMMGSVSTSYADIAETLKMPEWLDVKLFPEAHFDATHFTKKADNQYQATGTIKIRDKSVPVTLNFSTETLGKNKMRVKGSTSVRRLVFGIGQGEWASTSEVKDDVQVNFVLTASTK